MNLKEPLATDNGDQTGNDMEWRIRAPRRNMMEKRPGTILVVEDDPDTRHIVCEIMSDAGHSVHPAKDGLDALAHLERRPYDVLVTDYHMPSLNGLYLLTISRALWPNLPVIMVSGEFGRVRADAIRQGAYAWLSKPYQADQLLKTIESAVANAPALNVSARSSVVKNMYSTSTLHSTQ
jgi:two-component system, chemotaxis family, chemotaxis protein CheY